MPLALAQQQEESFLPFPTAPNPLPSLSSIHPFHTPAGTGVLKLGNSQGQQVTDTLPRSFIQVVGMRMPNSPLFLPTFPCSGSDLLGRVSSPFL